VKEENIDRAKQIQHGLVSLRKNREYIENENLRARYSLTTCNLNTACAIELKDNVFSEGTRLAIKALLLIDINRKIAELEAELTTL